VLEERHRVLGKAQVDPGEAAQGGVEEATRQGLPVAIVLDASVHEVSDFAVSCILAFSRNLLPSATDSI